jgi:hypothetical protein
MFAMAVRTAAEDSARFATNATPKTTRRIMIFSLSLAIIRPTS